jgi:Arc/MetJ-type ribon-helix-helix transcriptional regulator
MVDGRRQMKNITIALPENYIENIEKLHTLGMIPSRSEGIRNAIREFLKKETQVRQLLNYPETKKEKV